MTIPQGENRGPQSVSERRKVSYAGSSPCAGQQPPKTSPPHSTLSEDEISTAAANTLEDIKLTDTDKDSLEFDEDLLIVEDDEDDKRVKDIRNQRLYSSDHLEVNVTVVLPTDSKKTSLPLLNSLKGDGTGHSSERTRKLSLNLTKPFQKQLSEAKASEKTRRVSQAQKSSYERVPQEDPSPLSPQIFTLQHFGQVNPAFRLHQSESTHARAEQSRVSCCIRSTSRESSTVKKVFFGSQKTVTQAASSSFKSLDDLALVSHGGDSGIIKTIYNSRSASSEDLPASRKKKLISSGSSGGNHPRQQGDGRYPSTSSPSHCCLVSVSRVPMAAATSHLTLDSDYQVRRDETEFALIGKEIESAVRNNIRYLQY